MRRRAAATVAAAVLVLAVLTGNHGEPRPRSVRGVVDQPAAPTLQPAPVARPSAVRPARAALRWQLAAEHGKRRPIPAAAFTEQLATELSQRPPAQAPGQPPAQIVRLRELKTGGGLRQLVAKIRRGTQTDYVNVLLDCQRHCRVAGIQ